MNKQYNFSCLIITYHIIIYYPMSMVYLDWTNQTKIARFLRVIIDEKLT